MKCALEMHIYMENLNEIYFILTTKIDRCDHRNWGGRPIAIAAELSSVMVVVVVVAVKADIVIVLVLVMIIAKAECVFGDYASVNTNLPVLHFS